MPSGILRAFAPIQRSGQSETVSAKPWPPKLGHWSVPSPLPTGVPLGPFSQRASLTRLSLVAAAASLPGRSFLLLPLQRPTIRIPLLAIFIYSPIQKYCQPPFVVAEEGVQGGKSFRIIVANDATVGAFVTLWQLFQSSTVCVKKTFVGIRPYSKELR